MRTVVCTGPKLSTDLKTVSRGFAEWLSVRAMDAFEAFAAQWRSGMAVIEAAHGRSVIDLCRAGVDATIAKQIEKLGRIFCGPTLSTRKQADARKAAARNEHTINTLLEIERLVGKLDDDAHAWPMRLALTRQTANLRALRARGAELLAQYNAPTKPNPDMKLNHKAVPDSTLTDVSVRGPAHLAKAALDRAHALADETGLAPAEAFLHLAASDTSEEGSAPGTAQGPVLEPAIIIPLNEDVAGWEKLGVDEVRMSMTNGTTMTGADFVRANLAAQGYALIVDPITGEDLEIYRLYDEERFATVKQRLRQRLKTPVCAWPGCGKPADECQMHHIKAYKHGGKSEMKNYTMLCGFDNGRNDDDRDKPRYGHIEKIDGLDYWVPAFGGEPVLNDHPAARGGAIRLVRGGMSTLAGAGASNAPPDG